MNTDRTPSSNLDHSARMVALTIGAIVNAVKGTQGKEMVVEPNYRPVTEFRLEQSETPDVYRIKHDNVTIAMVVLPSASDTGWLSTDDKEMRRLCVEAMIETFNVVQDDIHEGR